MSELWYALGLAITAGANVEYFAILGTTRFFRDGAIIFMRRLCSKLNLDFAAVAGSFNLAVRGAGGCKSLTPLAKAVTKRIGIILLVAIATATGIHVISNA